MISLSKGETQQYLVCTLKEKQTIGEGYFLFVFTHVTTKDIVNVIYPFDDDLSNYKDRFNKFEINPQAVFVGYPAGFWKYEVYQQDSSENTDVDGLINVESGIMKLEPASEFSFVTPTESNVTFKQYEG